jgi:hypothetical protein
MKKQSFSSTKNLTLNLDEIKPLKLGRSLSLIGRPNISQKFNKIINSDSQIQKTNGKKLIINKSIKLKQIFQKRKFTPFSPIFKRINQSKKEIDYLISIGKKLCFSHKKNKSNELFLTSRNITTQKTNSKNLLTISSTSNNNIRQLTTNKSSKIITELNPIKNIFKPIETQNFTIHNSKKSLSQSSSTLSTLTIKKGREKTFVINYIPNWYIENNMIQMSLSKEIIKNSSLQKQIITDEINVLLDDIKIFKINYMNKKNLYEYIQKVSLNIQRKTNQKLEELIGLIIEISYILLKDYGNEIENFIRKPESKPSIYDNKMVEYEDIEFKINIQKFKKVVLFLNVCFECYEIIFQKENNFLLNSDIFIKLIQFLKRARLNISFLIFISKNIIEIVEKDSIIVDKFLNEMKRYEFNKLNSKKIQNEKKVFFEGGINPYKFKVNKEEKISDEQKKKKRLENLLNPKEINLNITYRFHKFNINSKLIDNILKYSTEKFKNQILSERIIQIYKNKEQKESKENIDL